MTGTLRFSNDVSEMDLDLVHRWLSEDAYWAKNRPRAMQDAAVANSRNYAIFDGETDAQLGYARIITDAATFAWLADVYVLPQARGRGVGKALVVGILAELDPLGMRTTALRTLDAHGLYEQYGFAAPLHPERWMERTPGE